jgi:hypothetical protein
MRLFSYPHMALIELKGDFELKMAVSACIRFENLKSKMPNYSDSKKTYFFTIRKGEKFKLVPVNTTIKQIHDEYKD